MLYGGIIAYIVLHGEISEMSAYIALLSSFTELALGPFGPQSSLSSPVWLLEASGKLWEASGKLWGASWRRPKSSWRRLDPSWSPLGAVPSPLGPLLSPLGDVLEALGGVLEAQSSNSLDSSTSFM